MMTVEIVYPNDTIKAKMASGTNIPGRIARTHDGRPRKVDSGAGSTSRRFCYEDESVEIEGICEHCHVGKRPNRPPMESIPVMEVHRRHDENRPVGIREHYEDPRQEGDYAEAR
jgi:hypothetical protein